jgi:hypothetical protein
VPTRTIECRDCHTEVETNQSQQLYCKVCRLYRNLIFLRDHTFECVVCEKTAAPLKRDAWVCCNCDPTMGCADVTGCCALCNKEAILPHDGIAVCADCLDSYEQRKLLIQALGAKVARMKEENGVS